ncbi:(2Fe-2S)-binding protein [Aurantiacibacter sediminis]|uniref:(2Fe-2S)-binding protein n=1 Tax=Aurantiacibacter sediminis TaxID=2793064 RepID=A0ABS0N6G7_9SPHN|nr:(2Fe-2S)-binding protein [Aurantiacibacter sediminis]MBH5323422.1 (2Fe-2S)-binding protein [Aurantiacibacter sediminis]
MYTCICNAIRECDLRQAARQHNGNAESVYAKLGKKPNCGNCLEEAEDVIREEREALIDPAIAA